VRSKDTFRPKKIKGVKLNLSTELVKNKKGELPWAPSIIIKVIIAMNKNQET
jgi:hypothetical protein